MTGTAIRKTAARKSLTKQLRALERVRSALTTAQEVLTTQGATITGTTGEQIAALLSTLGTGITVAEAAVAETANAVAQTYLRDVSPTIVSTMK